MTIRNGFTLVELLASTALSTLLMLVVVAALSGLARDRRSLDREERGMTDSPPDEAAELIRRDLSQADRFRAGPGFIQLSGYGSLDPSTLAPTHRPVRVVYRVEAADGRRWLVREQTDLDVNSNHDRWAERVCVGVSSVQLIASPDSLPPKAFLHSAAGRLVSATQPGTPTDAHGVAGVPAFDERDGDLTPSCVELIIVSDVPGTPALDRFMRVR